ncbi:MAG TPA: 1-deoxy-D-xylulose-5-phosphate synthase [Myxococcales bacterium]|nr:1-deoxy-D-xylulose-5-phosphate synthase [Myxococcales bacterium]
MTAGPGDLLFEVDSPQKLRALPEELLPELCRRLRQEIVDICGQVGGHLGASLGAVELIVALHRVFKSPADALVFDTGHQAYAHKLLTGRAGGMGTLRQSGGVAPFLDPTESAHDAFGAGHACTAVSAALGILEGKALRGEEGRAVAVVGDGSLTGGLTFEGLNNAGASERPLLVVLNDNQMSISRNVGSIPAALRTQGGARALFEAMGFSYVGPVDGHDVLALVAALRPLRGARRPALLHAVTQKGKGFPAAESDALTRGHAMGPYEWRDGKLVRSRGPGQRTFSEAFAGALEARMAADRSVAVVTPAMLEGSALTGLKARFPDRVFDVGIAEQHAVTFGAGLARAGMRPVCCLYSTFLQRAYDQVVHDVCVQGLPVVLAVDRAGLVGADGATHQGAYDVSFLRPLPGMLLCAPVLGEDLGPLLDAALAHPGPSAIRFPRGTLPAVPPEVEVPGQAVAPGTARWLRRAKEPALALVALGTPALAALEAARDRPSWSVLDARFAAPLDREAVLEAARCGRVVTVEEGTRRGGLGSAVLEALAEAGASARVRVLGLPDQPVRHGDARAQRAELGLDAAGIRRAAEELLG